MVLMAQSVKTRREILKFEGYVHIIVLGILMKISGDILD